MNNLQIIKEYSATLWDAKDISAIDRFFKSDAIINSPVETTLGNEKMKVTVRCISPDWKLFLAKTANITRSKVGYDEIEMTENQAEQLIKSLIEKRHFSPFEFIHFHLMIEDVSRAFTHQWVRYRIGITHLQQSLRYVDVSESGIIVPPTIKGTESEQMFLDSVKKSQETYKSLLKADVPQEDARFVLPIGTKTMITSVVNARELWHIFEQRLCFTAQWEIRKVTREILKQAKLISPILFTGDHIGPPCIREDCPEKDFECPMRK